MREAPVGAAPQPARGGWHLDEWGAEFLGTAILLLGGLSAVVIDFGRGSPLACVVPSHSWRLLFTGLLFAGTGSLVAVSPLGRRSGAHLNPAVTFAFWLDRHVHPHDLIGYVVSQCLGGLLGAAVVRALWGRMALSVHGGATEPGPHVSTAAAVVLEGAMTAGLILTIFFFVSSPRTARWTPLAVWIVVAVLVWRVAPLTGTSLNPARSLGPAVVFHRLRWLWVYFAGPLSGSLLGVGLWRLIARRRRVLTPKMFHDPRYPSTMRTVLPARPPEG